MYAWARHPPAAGDFALNSFCGPHAARHLVSAACDRTGGHVRSFRDLCFGFLAICEALKFVRARLKDLVFNAGFGSPDQRLRRSIVPSWLVWREHRHLDAVGPEARVEDIDCCLVRSSGESGKDFQS